VAHLNRYRVVPPHIYISICILSWGIIACLQSVAPSFAFLVVLRALLGIGEAAFSPGVPFYLSFFFRRRELAFRTGLFISASPLSSAFAGVLAWLISKMASHTWFSPWRLLFLLEGIPSMFVAVWAWSFIPDGPGVVKWLTPRQRKVAVLRLRQEKEDDDYDHDHEEDHHQHPSTKPSRININEVLQTLRDPKCYLTAFMMFSCNVAFGSIPVFLPTIVQDMGFESITAQGLTAPPYLVAFLAVIATASLSDRLESRSFFIIIHALLASLGYGTIAVLGSFHSPHTLLRYFALYPAIAGFFCCITVIITWTLNNQESDSRKGTGMAMLNIIGQCGPLVGTSIFPDEDGPWYVRGMGICGGFMVVVALLAGVLRWVLIRENRRAREGRGGGAYAGIPVDDGGGAETKRKVFEYML
jgi:MFS family permease